MLLSKQMLGHHLLIEATSTYNVGAAENIDEEEIDEEEAGILD